MAGAKRKSKVVFYYITHTGRGSLGPKFRRLLRKADVLDIESAREMPKDGARMYEKIAKGDRNIYRKFTDFRKRRYAETGSPSDLYLLSLADALYGSKKKIEFEMPPVHATPARAGDDAAFEAAMAGLMRRVHARAIEDSLRIADALEANPGQKRLVERGTAHYITAELLRKELERRGVKAEIREVYPPVKRSVIGTPYHVPPGEIIRSKARIGKKITGRDMELASFDELLTGYLSQKGWKITKIQPHLGALASEMGDRLILSRKERVHLAEHPGEIRRFYLKRGIDIEKPWWSHGKKVKKTLKR